MSGTVINNFIDLMNRYGAEKEPFMFIIDFDMINPEIHKLTSVPAGIKFLSPLLSNIRPEQIYTKPVSLIKYPVPFSIYSKAFNSVIKNIKLGNSYLLNLTFPTEVETELTLEEIFYASFAKYKLLYHDKFVVFSPEIFVRIHNGEIKSFPMKGTIDSSVNDAEDVIMNDEKEEAEHNTIVDLIRNDLSKVADNVVVARYRYIDRIKSGESELLQVSSEITGSLKEGWEKNLGDLLAGMLPAGSVTGAPKKETLRIIKESENFQRGWYSGVFGVFDGKSLDSAVMIRFIEKESERFFFKSGGGITYLSDPVKEYDELISKVYVPVG
jgi:para-aminobenzoate synthetase component 1